MIIIFNIIKLIFEILKKKKICFLSSPSQLICLNEFFFKKNINDVTIIIGYPSDASIEQIRIVFKKLDHVKNKKIIFLSEFFNEKVFTFILKFIKFIIIFKTTIIGDFNYYHAKGVYRYSRKTIFLDEGINFLNLKKNELKPKYSFFTIFRDFKSKHAIEINNYDYLKSKIKNLKVNKNLIYLLGTSDANPEMNALDKRLYLSLIQKICAYYNDKKIIFIPHRNEMLKNIEELKIVNLSIKINQCPIELFLTNQNEIPFQFLGFYSMALINLKIILQNNEANVFNINYNLKTLKDENLSNLYKIYQENFDKFDIKELNV